MKDNFVLREELNTHDSIAMTRPLSESEQVLLENIDYIKPNTSFRPGDTAVLMRAPQYMLNQNRNVPVVWQVRFIISAWAYRVYSIALGVMQNGSWDEALYAYSGDLHTLFRSEIDIPPSKWKTPIIYAHGFPHGEHPDSAAWFQEKHLRRVATRVDNVVWPHILDEARAPYVGIEAPFGLTFDVAPDLYANGENLQRPFSFEEPTYHALCQLGYEETMHSLVHPRFYTPRIEEY